MTTMPTDRFDPDRHHRRSLRLPDWDYRSQAYYFVTLCTGNRENLFAAAPLADIAAMMWLLIPQKPHAEGVYLDEWVIMPNHLHGLLLLPGPPPNEVPHPEQETVIPGLPFDMRYAARPPAEPSPGDRPKLAPGSLGAIIGNYKSGVTRRINALRRTPGHRVWQRGFNEHIVRDHRELQRIQNYIRENPARWAEDRENLDAVIARMTYRE